MELPVLVSPLPTGFRWGYAWPYLRGYKRLTDEDKTRLEEALGR